MDVPKRRAAKRGGASSTTSSSPSYNERAQYESSYIFSPSRISTDAEASSQNATSDPYGMPMGSTRSPWSFKASPSAMPGFNSVDSGYGSASFRPPSHFAKFYPDPFSMSPSGFGQGHFNDFDPSSTVAFTRLLGNTDIDALHIPQSMRHRYVCLLARLIAESVACYRPTPDVIDEIYLVLPDLLEQFALSLGGTHYSVMVVLLKYKM